MVVNLQYMIYNVLMNSIEGSNLGENSTNIANKSKNKPKKFTDRYDFIFLAWFGVIFLISLLTLSLLGLAPKEISTSSESSLNGGLSLESTTNTSLFGVDFTKGTTQKFRTVSEISNDDLPVRITISKIDLDTKILNTDSTNASFLDNELSKAPVRYPGSGTLSSGNIFVFGHSTGFKIVQNPAYKVFNDIKTLVVGDQITVYSLSGKPHIYSVVSAKVAKKEDTWIDFSSSSPSLTLSTCDSLSQIGDRFVVKAVSVQ